MMMKLIVVVVVVGLLIQSVVGSFTESEYRAAFTGWMQEHGRAYTTEEFQARYEIFRENMEYVNAWNAVNSSTVLGLNGMADLTNEEYQRIYLGTHYIAGAEEVNVDSRIVLPHFDALLSDSLDWRVSGAVTSIKDQGQCGSCWAFSTTGSVEGAFQVSTGKLISLSEQNLMDCSSNYGNQACDGGLMVNAFNYIIANKGIDTETSYPYKMRKQSCLFSVNDVGATISGYKNVPAKNEGQLQLYLTKQPVSVAIDASHKSFQLYQSGVYYEPECSSVRLDHGVLAVGYGTDSNSEDYWIVKNSWGVKWGLQGYINMARNKDNHCGIASMASIDRKSVV